MSVLWMEGFGLFGNIENVFRKYSGNTFGTLSLVNPGRISGDALKIHRTNELNIFSLPSLPGSSTFILGFGMQLQGTIPTFSRIVNFMLLDNLQISLGVTSDGRLQFHNYNNSLITQTTSGNITTNTWYYIEVKVVVHETNGQITLRINNSPVIDVAASTMSPALVSSGYPNHINGVSFLVTFSSTMDLLIDDIYVANSVAEGTSSINNNFLGSVYVEGYLPDGYFNLGNDDWSLIGSGSYHTAVNEKPTDNDLSYIECNSVSKQALFTIGSLSGPSNDPVHALELNILAKKNGAGASKIYPAIHNSGQSNGQSPVILYDNYLYGNVVHNVDPWDFSPITVQKVNGWDFAVSSDLIN